MEKSMREIQRIAGLDGRIIEEELDKLQDGEECDIDKLNYSLDHLKRNVKPLYVYETYISIYNSLKPTSF